MMTSKGKEVQAVNTERLKSLMTCPICDKIFKDATTISECLHTFCRKCIFKNITKEELNCCPVCNIDLGCAPLEKLRPDHNWQDIRAKIFSSTRREAKEREDVTRESMEPEFVKRDAKEPEVAPSIPLPTRRKERSLSSLVSTPKVSKQTVTTGRRKPAARKPPASRGSTFYGEEPIKKVEDRPESSSSPVTLGKNTQNRKQNYDAAESSKQQMPNKDTGNGCEPLEGMTDLWKPLTCLVEAAGITKPSKSNSHGFVAKLASSGVVEDEANAPKAKIKESGNKSKVQNDKNGSTPVPSGSVKSRKMNRGRQKRAIVSEGLNIPAQALIDAASSKCETRVNPIWFSLVASDHQEGDAPLPQIPSCYLMIKDVNLSVSFIKKYLVQKLGLISEAEVEISLRGQPLLPTLQLHNVVDLWLQTAPKSKRITTVGSSAKDFVMVLSYGRKAQPS